MYMAPNDKIIWSELMSWSLKDKGMRGYPNGEPTGIYSQEVIETLRQKLIEDLCCGVDYVSPGKILHILNERFGVEE